MTDLEAAWDALRATLPPGWVVGRPSYHHERGAFYLYAHDPRERPKVGRRTREAEAWGATEADVVVELARRLSTRGEPS